MRRAVAAWVTSVLGPVHEHTDLSRNGGRVVAVTDGSGRDWVVKTVPTQQAFRNEVNAYRHWVPRFADQAPAFVTSGLERLSDFGHLPLAPCHGDDSGHNWLRGDGPLRVIDFSRLFVGPWWERPDFVREFFEGYGRPLGDDELEAVRHQLPAFALSVMTHGHRRGNTEMVRRGRLRLHRLMAGHDFTRRAPRVRRVAGWARRLT